jgi:hypothetical protein
MLASWQTVGGCGASAATGAGAGVKWIGRNVSGGLFGVQSQTNYTRFVSDQGHVEHQVSLSTLVTREVTDRWIIGANIPFAFKYLVDPYDINTDITNTGLGDVNLLLTHKFGPTNATVATASLGLPTGTWDASFKMKPLRQHQQLGFGKVQGSLMLDHTFDQLWGIVVVGSTVAYRGGENKLSNYRAPTATGYTYLGHFLGPFMPAAGIAVTGFAGHDRDQTQDESTALFNVAPSFSLEWATDWVALLVGASFPYQYDGIYKDSEGFARNPWGWGPWIVAVGASFAPF